mmetsp:Transcript_94014/g.271762  ORF Transcript_94014/g.271762 Transcript_94014/m.271762 type:complete len:527 (-) Transcript_94014:1199-2779(-)
MREEGHVLEELDSPQAARSRHGFRLRSGKGLLIELLHHLANHVLRHIVRHQHRNLVGAHFLVFRAILLLQSGHGPHQGHQRLRLVLRDARLVIHLRAPHQIPVAVHGVVDRTNHLVGCAPFVLHAPNPVDPLDGDADDMRRPPLPRLLVLRHFVVRSVLDLGGVDVGRRLGRAETGVGGLWWHDLRPCVQRGLRRCLEKAVFLGSHVLHFLPQALLARFLSLRGLRVSQRLPVHPQLDPRLRVLQLLPFLFHQPRPPFIHLVLHPSPVSLEEIPRGRRFRVFVLQAFHPRAFAWPPGLQVDPPLYRADLRIKRGRTLNTEQIRNLDRLVESGDLVSGALLKPGLLVQRLHHAVVVHTEVHLLLVWHVDRPKMHVVLVPLRVRVLLDGRCLEPLRADEHPDIRVCRQLSRPHRLQGQVVPNEAVGLDHLKPEHASGLGLHDVHRVLIVLAQELGPSVRKHHLSHRSRNGFVDNAVQPVMVELLRDAAPFELHLGRLAHVEGHACEEGRLIQQAVEAQVGGHVEVKVP